MTSDLRGGIGGLADEIAASIDRRPALWVAGFSVVYFVCAGWLALIRPMWHDEFFTFFIARSPDSREVFKALMTGADQHPPTFYLLSRLAFPLLGANQFSVRIPELYGYWLASVCLFAFVSRRTSPAFGFVAMLFPLVTEAYDYAFEARGYALVMGFTALAFLCWQAAADGGRRPLAIAGLALSSAAAVGSHYYAVFALFALAVGEIARTIGRKRIDWAVWVALFVAIVPLIAFAPYIRSAADWSAHFWGRPAWSDIPETYAFLFGPSALAGVLMIGAFALDAMAKGTTPAGPERSAHCPMPSFELVAVLALLGTPVVTVAAAKLATGAFSPRYALSSVIAASVLLSVSLCRLTQGRRSITGFVALALLAGFAARQSSESRVISATRKYLANTSEWLRSTGDTTLTIVAWHADGFLRLRYYARPEVRSRLVHLSDAGASMRFLGNDTGERGLLALSPWFGSGIQQYRSFLGEHSRFLIFGSMGDFARAGRNWNWLLPQLLVDRAEIRLIGVAGDDVLGLVTLTDSARSAAHDGRP